MGSSKSMIELKITDTDLKNQIKLHIDNFRSDTFEFDFNTTLILYTYRFKIYYLISESIFINAMGPLKQMSLAKFISTVKEWVENSKVRNEYNAIQFKSNVTENESILAHLEYDFKVQSRNECFLNCQQFFEFFCIFIRQIFDNRFVEYNIKETISSVSFERISDQELETIFNNFKQYIVLQIDRDLEHSTVMTLDSMINYLQLRYSVLNNQLRKLNIDLIKMINGYSIENNWLTKKESSILISHVTYLQLLILIKNRKMNQLWTNKKQEFLDDFKIYSDAELKEIFVHFEMYVINLISEIFFKVDKNLTGEITFDDFECIWSQIDKKQRKEEIREKFSEIDEDGSGTVDQTEFENFCAPILSKTIRFELSTRGNLIKNINLDIIKGRWKQQLLIRRVYLLITGKVETQDSKLKKFNQGQNKVVSQMGNRYRPASGMSSTKNRCRDQMNKLRGRNEPDGFQDNFDQNKLKIEKNTILDYLNKNNSYARINSKQHKEE